METEALKKNATLSTPTDYDHVIEWVKAGQTLFKNNVENKTNYFKPTEEFLKDQNTKDTSFEKACELLRVEDKKVAKIKFTEWNKTQQEPKVDTTLDSIFSQAIKQIKKESIADFGSDEDSYSIQVYKIGISLIEEKSRSQNDTSQVVVKVRINEKPQWIDIKSSMFQKLLRVKSQEAYGEIFSDSIYDGVIKNIHAEILLSGIESKPIFKRCAFVDGIIYYNLQDEDGTIIKITKDLIEELEKDDTMPIFIKTSRPNSNQPKPNYSDKEALTKFVKLCRIEEEDRIIFKSLFVTRFLKNIPIPIGIYHGEQSSAKTSVSSAVKSLLDPEGENVMSLPEKIDDLVIMMMNREEIVLDNCETISREMSQFLCKSVTGTTYGKRELFTTSDEFNVILKEKIMLNGISPSINQPDLLECSIFFELKKIDKEKRITDDDFIIQINEIKPFVLGCIFTTLQKALTKYDEVKNELTGKSLPRMASFAVWGESISRSIGDENNKFIERYNEKLDVSSLSLQEDYPMIQPFMEFVKEIGEHDLKKGHEESLKILFDKIIVSLGIDRDARLPANTKSFGKELKQLAPMIRNLGFEVSTRVFNERNRRCTHEEHT